jgi:hypothetical protein
VLALQLSVLMQFGRLAQHEFLKYTVALRESRLPWLSSQGVDMRTGR